MSGPDHDDDPKGPTGEPEDDIDEFADLVSELDAWDRMFDSLHDSGGAASSDGGPRPITPTPIGADIAVSESAPFAAGPAATDRDTGGGDDDELELEIEPTALGSLLGDLIAESDGTVLEKREAKATRSSPAIVRREDLERFRRERDEGLEAEIDFGGPSPDYELDLGDDAAGDWDVAPVTSVMAKATVDRMVETAAAFFDDDEDGGEVELELDADFYDDIEIDDAKEDAGGVDEAVPVAVVGDAEGSFAARRTMAHVVRRAPVVAGPTAPPPLEAGDDEVVVEIEADHEELEMLVDPGTQPGIGDGLGLAPAPVERQSDAAPARPQPTNRIDSIEKLREALDLDQPVVSGELISQVPAEGARAIESGGLAPTSLPEVEMPPELPPRVLTRAVPGLDAVELAVPHTAADAIGDRTDEQVLKLEQARAAIERHGSGPARGRLHLWAAELAAELGDLDELERHAAAAVADDPELAAYAGVLRRRRMARLGEWEAVAEALAEAAEAAGADSAEAAALSEIAAELLVALGQAEPAGGDHADINHRWRAMLAAATGRPAALDDAAPALAEAIADAPMRAALMRLWSRRRGADAWAEATRIAPDLSGDLIAWELAAVRGPSARATAALQIAARLEEQSRALALVDSLCIVAGEAYRATGNSERTREILSSVADRQAAHPVLARGLLGVLGPDDRETAGYLLAAVSGTALAPEAARALRRWAESDTGASRAERLRRAQALCPGDPLVRADIEAAERDVDPDASENALEVSVGLALAPRVSGDPVALLNSARDLLAGGDAESALAELGRGQLPRGELLVGAEILDAADVAGPAAAVNAWRAIAPGSNASRALLGRRIVLSQIDQAIAERGDGEPDLSQATSELVAMAPSDRIAARAVLAESLSAGIPELGAIAGEAASWPGIDAAGLALERAALAIDGEVLAEPQPVLAMVDDLDDPRTEWLAVAALGRAGDWQRAADRVATDPSAAAMYRAAYILLERADDATAAESRLAEIADASPELAPLSDLLDAARRRLGVGGEMARPVRARRRSSDPWTATITGAEMAQRAGDLKRAIDIYKRALGERPGDPIALEGLEWAARAALDAAPLADRALSALRAAEDHGDIAARADAYAALARIDSEIRGDPASALLAWESCADLDPSQPEALRALERAYLAGGRHRELLLLYGRLLASAEGDRETAALLHLRARSAEQVGRDRAEVLGDYRQIIELDDRDRMALFHLEASAHNGPPTDERADLERRVSAVLGADPRSAAAFLCRSGETIAGLGDHAGAAARFVEALAIHQGHVPAIRGWRHASLVAGDWQALAEATEAEAAVAHDATARIELFHLAGVLWMDKVADSEQARRALSAVLALDPHHEDAFARMRLLFDEVGDDESLGDLLRQLLESSPPADVALGAHLELAGLCRNFWEDREGAVGHLEAVLELAPQNRKAIAELSDINWELGRWDAAAEVLIRRAKLETDTKILKHIFYRLGTIYADHLPDSRWALRCFRKVLTYDADDIPTLDRMAMLAADGGDHKTALAAYERLLRLEQPAEDKVRYLHRVAELQENALGQPAGAERALRIAFDLAPHSKSALRRLVDFYTRAGDMTSIRVNLDRAAQAMRARIVADPLEPAPYVVIARVLETREAAGVPGSRAVAQAAAEIARALGDESREAAEIAGSRTPGRPRLAPLAAPEVDDLLIPRVVPAGLRVVFSSLRSRLPRFIGADVKRFGVGRGDRLRKGKHPVANLAREIADELGVGNVEVYVSTAVTDKAMVVPTSPPSVILGARFASLDRGAELAFALGRCLKLAQMGLAMVDTMTAPELDLLVAGIVRQFAGDFLAFNLDDAALSAEQHRLRRLIPGGLAEELRPHALALTGVLLEPEMLHASLRLCGLRAGLVASGNAAAALAAGLRHGGYSSSQEAAADPDINGLLRFAVSEEHVEIQSLLAAK